jgi:hypothetical protein
VVKMLNGLSIQSNADQHCMMVVYDEEVIRSRLSKKENNGNLERAGGIV